MKHNYRVFCALLSATVLILQYAILLHSGENGGFAATTLTYFGYFTILTNSLVALAFAVVFYKENSRLKSFFERPIVRAAIALYIFVVCIVYYALLAKDHNPTGLSAILNVFLHLIIPILYLIDWGVFAPKHSLTFKSIPLWVVYPLLYGVFNIVRGLLTGFYPYPFLDVSKLGWAGVSQSMFGFIILYAVGAAAVIVIARRLPQSN